MGMQLPDWLRYALEMIGMEWPATDESKVAAWADDWRALAGGGDGQIDLRSAVAGLAARNEGAGVSAFVAHITEKDSVMVRYEEFSQGCEALAGACEGMSVLVLALKGVVIGHLVTLALAISAAVATGGLGAAAVLVAKQVAKEAIGLAISEAVNQLLLE